METFTVLKKAVLSEKSNLLRESGNKYTFIVHPQANKHQIKQAVNKAFDVKVEQVNVSIRRGKIKRRGQTIGKQANTKRAVVTLAPEQKISVFEDR